jgi:two-component system phosphate regulon response regulator OmpR
MPNAEMPGSPSDAFPFQAHVVVVDDDPKLRQLLAKYLQEAGYLVSAMESVAATEALLALCQPDVLLMDVMMPHTSGLAFLQTYATGPHHAPVLLMSALGETDDRIRGLSQGAEDYIAKPFDPRELLLRIQNVLRRQHSPAALHHEACLQFGPYRYVYAQGTLLRDNTAILLTTVEHKLLRTLAETPGTAVTRSLLADACDGIGERSVDVQIVRLRHKLEEDPRNPRYIQTVWGKGYVLQGIHLAAHA